MRVRLLLRTTRPRGTETDGRGKEADRGGKVDRVTDLFPVCTGLCEMPRDPEREISIFASRSIFDLSGVW